MWMKGEWLDIFIEKKDNDIFEELRS